MSRVCFNNRALGWYDFGTQHIEIDCESIGISYERAAAVLAKSMDSLDGLSEADVLFYKTYIHEMTHLLDSTSTLWGISYSSRMYSYYSDPSSDRALNVLSLSDSEIQQHNSLSVGFESELLDYRALRISLEYDRGFGVFVAVHYLKLDAAGAHVVHSIPLSMLAILEGHAYAQESLFALNYYKSIGDPVSICLLESEMRKIFSSKDKTEYTCALSLVNQLLPRFDLESRLRVIISLSRISLNASAPVMSAFAYRLVDEAFLHAHPEFRSSLKLDISRGLNRSSLFSLLLLALASHVEINNIHGEEVSFEYIESLLSSYLDIGVDSVKNWSWDMEYEVNIEYLDKLGAELPALMAREMKPKSWYEFDFSKTLLPSVAVGMDEYLVAPKPLHYDMPSHYDRYYTLSKELSKKIGSLPVKKDHLSPATCHDWLGRISRGERGIAFYPDERTY